MNVRLEQSVHSKESRGQALRASVRAGAHENARGRNKRGALS